MSEDKNEFVPAEFELSVRIGEYNQTFAFEKEYNPALFADGKRVAEDIQRLADCAVVPATTFYDASAAAIRANRFSSGHK